MKRNIFLIIIVILLFIVGCSSKSKEIEAQNEKNGSSNKKQDVAVGGSTSGSTAFAYSVVVGDIVGNNTGIRMQIQETSGTVDGVRQLIDNGADIVVSAAGTTIDAKLGRGPFETNGENNDLRLLWNLYSSPFNMVVSEDSGINSPQDFEGKRVGAGAPGSGSYIMLIDVLEAYGVNLDKLDIQSLTPEEQDTAFRDGHLDVMTFQAGPQTAWLMDLSRTRNLKWIDVAEDYFNKLVQNQPNGYYVYSEIPAGGYENQKEEINTVAANIEWLTTSRLDEETVYNITRAFWDNKDKADEMHTIIKTNSLESSFGSASTEWHPGVIKYLEEKEIEFAEYQDD